ncbi:MAG TPA: phenylalanine--tRNA ligase subunit alpha, partial [Hanamia sp.]
MMENLLSRINELREEINNFSENDQNAAEIFRIKFIGSNGSVKSLMSEMKNVSPENKREMGKVLNDLKLLAESKHEEIKKSNGDKQSSTAKNIDLTLPGDALPMGGRHPISIVRNKIVSIFHRLGFAVAEGP